MIIFWHSHLLIRNSRRLEVGWEFFVNEWFSTPQMIAGLQILSSGFRVLINVTFLTSKPEGYTISCGYCPGLKSITTVPHSGNQNSKKPFSIFERYLNSGVKVKRHEKTGPLDCTEWEREGLKAQSAMNRNNSRSKFRRTGFAAGPWSANFRKLEIYSRSRLYSFPSRSRKNLLPFSSCRMRGKSSW